jgi:ABC-type multidrug transport system ATPase subunit
MVEEIIEVLGLEKCRDSVIGDQEIRGVSGGQRKRVSIAVELVSNVRRCRQQGAK